ncbi:exo-beta-1,3-glucanase [Roridomyces roridus]|uniref:Exo-beta-1,3-glucanase n=1 Tax=Roridomyces roridus TaxID=1738132 RepID=A0AAD7BVV7_9AGAR|nr:exo-beta-1,3-glucanase [Roridomyces roridus]
MLPLFLSLMGLALNALALGTSCSAPLGAGTAAPSDPFWLQNIKHQGLSAFNPTPSSYQVYRNVKDFGAVGDGVHDDTAAINAAISLGDRCFGAQNGCNSSTIAPAVVFFPKGTYLISTSIIALYYTQLIGDANAPPTILATAGFTGDALIDADPYIPGGGGAQYYTNQNNFFRSVRNFVIDTTRIPISSIAGTGLHWQLSQSTSLQNIVVNMPTAPGTAHRGIWMENGSGGFMGDLITNGGGYGLYVGNQQFTVRNVTINNAVAAAVGGTWNWGWTWQGIRIQNCPIGFDLTTGSTADAQFVSGEMILDATVTNVPIFIRTSTSSNGQLIGAGSLVLNNIRLNNVPTAIATVQGAVVLAGTSGSTTIASWAQGNVYKGTNPAGTFTQGNIASPSKPAVLLDSAGNVFSRGRPHVRDQGAKGDGNTDDTAALQAVFNQFSGCKIIFFDAGTYVITSTLKIPAGTQMVGEGWSVIAARGSFFQDINNPQVAVQVGAPGSTGVMEITDIVFSVIGSTGGTIMVEWNIKGSSQGAAGMWDSHIRLGGSAWHQPPAAPVPQLRSRRNSQLYGSLPCSPLDGPVQRVPRGLAPGCGPLTTTWTSRAWEDISLYSGRGILSESAGPVWMIGTGAEHFAMYQYSLVGAQNHYMGLIQTETPYYQPNPSAPTPFTINGAFSDPTSVGTSAWGLVVSKSSNILIFGAGLYSFFSTYSQDCLDTTNCQSQIVNIDSTSQVAIYSLSTVGTTTQIHVNNQPIINQSSNLNGFASLVSAWTS